MLDLFAASAGDFLDGWFESAPIKAAFGFDSVVGNYASPYTAGSAYVLLHHSFGEVNGRKGVWGHAIGGMGAITQAMAKAAAARGVDIRLSTRVRQVIVENGRAIGVETDKSEPIRAAAIAAGINPKLLYLHLVDASRSASPPTIAPPAPHLRENQFCEPVDTWRCSVSVRSPGATSVASTTRRAEPTVGPRSRKALAPSSGRELAADPEPIGHCSVRRPLGRHQKDPRG